MTFDDYQLIVLRLFLALLTGGLIGLERTLQGRPAGFRTHALVCTASALMMLFTLYQWRLIGETPTEIIRFDPARMAQGIMTGIGFLGGGVIMKDKLSIRGLTTAASIWITASLGITLGMGFYSASLVGTLFTLGILYLFQMFEKKLPSREFGKLLIYCHRSNPVLEEEIFQIIHQVDVDYTSFGFSLKEGGEILKYQTTLSTRTLKNFSKLNEILIHEKRITHFSLTPTKEA